MRSMRNMVLIAVAAAMPLAGCANLSPGEQRAVTGTGIGAAGGAVLGAIAGNAGLGAGLGAAAGLAGGLLYDQAKQSQADAYRSGYNAGAYSRPPPPPPPRY